MYYFCGASVELEVIFVVIFLVHSASTFIAGQSMDMAVKHAGAAAAEFSAQALPGFLQALHYMSSRFVL